MKVKSFGCSFVYGSELSDCINTPSNLTWPALLAKDRGLAYECYAQPGIGNLQIANRVLTQIASNDPAIYVINWTMANRFDYVYREEWTTLRPPWREATREEDIYFRWFQNDNRDKLTMLMEINTVLDMLKRSKSKFIMTYMDPMITTVDNNNPSIALLQTAIKDHLHTFDGLNFIDFAKKENCAIGIDGHPLESAHQMAFEHIQRLV